MRLKGTGKDPENRYPEGLIFDAPPVQAKGHIDAGHAVPLDPADDPARTPSQVAAAVQRGDNLNNPDDQVAAADISESDALASVQGGPVDDPIDGGATMKAPLGNPEPGLPEDSAPAAETDVKELSDKQKLVEQAKALDISHSGTAEELQKRIDARKEEIAEAEEAAKTAAEAGSGDGEGDGSSDGGGGDGSGD